MNNLFLIVVAVFTLAACSKNNTDLPYYKQISDEAYVGNWEWVATGGGFTGHYMGPNEYGDHTLTLTEGSAYELVSGDTVVASGEYEINEKVLNNRPYDEVVFHNYPISDNGLIALIQQTNISVNDEQLILGSFYSVEYKREE